jgi:transcriptional regulator
MSSARFPIPQGTLDMLILQVLSLEAAHGYAIAQRLQQISRDTVQVNQGSLYPALHRLEKRGWLKAEWGLSEANQRAKFYRLTAAGKAQLTREQDRWSQLVHAIGRIMNAAQE